MDEAVTVTFDKGTNNNAPKYYDNGTAIRCYGGNTFTITSTAGNITNIVLTYGGSDGANAITTDVGAFSSGTWTGSSKSVTFTVGGTTGNRRIAGISVTYEGTNSGTPVAPNAPTLTESCSFDDAMNVAITNISDGATVYYTTDRSTPSASNGTVYSAPFEITATTTVKAIAVNEAGTSDVVSATYTKNQSVDSGITDVLNREITEVPNGTDYFAWSGKSVNSSAVYAGQSAGRYNTIQLRSDKSNSGIISTTSGGKLRKIKVDWNSNTAEGRTLRIYGNNSPYTTPAELYDTDNNNDNQGTLLGEIVCGESTVFVVEGDYTYVGLRSQSGAMYLNSVEITWEEDVWGSLYYPTAVEIPANVKAYIVTAANNSYVTLTQVTGALPANTGVIYNGKWSEYATTMSEGANVEGNLLRGSLSNTYVEGNAYVLAKVDGEVGFYLAAKNKDENGNAGASHFLNNANKAYLPVDNLPSSVQNAKALKFNFNTTAVENVKVETEGKKVIYDLSGRRVNDMTAPGLYIVNGKKVMVK